MRAPEYTNEEERLAALYRYQILDTEPEEFFDDITKLVAGICDAPVALISLVDQDRQWFKSKIGIGLAETPLEMSICAHAILQPGVLVVPDTQDDPRFADNPLVSGDPHLRFYAGSLLENPDGLPLGTLCVLDYKPRTLTTEQRNLLEILSRHIMVQLELRRMAIEQRRVAETLQRAMLILPSPNQFPGLEIETLYEAAMDEAKVGGDFFDAFSLPDGKVALCVGDVSGKGLMAAARTAEVKYALRAFLYAEPSSEHAVERLNDFICHTKLNEDQEHETFIVMALVIIDTKSGQCQFISAGSESTIITRHDGTSELCTASGQPLGIMPEAKYHAQSFLLNTHDLVILTTDGITEARQGREFFEVTGIQHAVASVTSSSLREITKTIYQHAIDFSGGRLRDDACLLLARLLTSS